MSFSQSLKTRLDLFVELHPWLRPLRTVISFLLTLRFKLVNTLLRNWLLLRFVVVRLLWGKKLVVIYRDIGIGDIVNTFPLIAELKTISSHEVIVYVTHQQFRSFVRKFSGANVVIGTSYVLFSQPLPRIPAWVATKALHPLYLGEDPASPKSERLGYVLEMAGSCGISLSDPRPKLTVDDSEAISVLHRHNHGRSSRPYIGIHLGPTVPVREWPFESWRQLVELLSHRLQATIFQFGSKWHSCHPVEMK